MVMRLNVPLACTKKYILMGDDDENHDRASRRWCFFLCGEEEQVQVCYTASLISYARTWPRETHQPHVQCRMHCTAMYCFLFQGDTYPSLLHPAIAMQTVCDLFICLNWSIYDASIPLLHSLLLCPIRVFCTLVGSMILIWLRIRSCEIASASNKSNLVVMMGLLLEADAAYYNISLMHESQ